MNELENALVMVSIICLFIGVPTIFLCRCTVYTNKIINIPVITLKENGNKKYIEI